jgi:ATP-dependent Lon protease
MQFGPEQAVPILPQPELTLFPGVTASIHVHELAHRTLVRDALAGERQVVVALLKPGWQREDQPCPELFSLACLARFEEVTWLPNDHYDLRLRGLARVRIGRSVRDFPYRACRVAIVPQDPLSEDDPLVQLERRAVLDAYTRFLRVVWPRSIDRSPSHNVYFTFTDDQIEAATLGKPARIDALLESLGFEALINTVCLMVNVGSLRLLPLFELDSLVERAQRLRETMEAELREPHRRSPGNQESN